MRVTLTHVVAALASVTVALSTAIPEVGGSDVAVSVGSDITASSEFTDFGLSSAGTEVYQDDDFIGTPEEIYAKANTRLASLGLGKGGELVAKNKIFQPLCNLVSGWDWKAALVSDANKCRDSMGNGGRFFVNPRSCARVCCINGNAVFICNDNTDSINPALSYIQGYVCNIIDHCSFTTIAGQLAGGQMFDTDRYNVILRGGQGLATDCAYGPWKK